MDWLRAAEHWAAAGPDGSLPSKDGSLVAAPSDEDASSRRKAYAALHLATLAKRFRQLAAPRIADSSLERLARDVQGGDGDSSTQRLLAARSASAIAEVVAHLPEKLDADRCDCCVEGLVAALTHSADVWPDRASFLRHAAKALSPACAAVAERVQDVPKRRDFASSPPEIRKIVGESYDFTGAPPQSRFWGAEVEIRRGHPWNDETERDKSKPVPWTDV